MESKRIETLKRKARKYSIIDGAFATIKNSLGNSYIIPFALAINASNSLIAFFSSIPGLLGPLTQLFSSRLIEKYKRKLIVTKAIFFEALLWIPLITIAYLYFIKKLTSLLPILLLIFFSILVITESIGGPAWFSWVGDIVSEQNRGKWFGKRIFIHSTIAVIFTIIAAFFLDTFKKHNYTMIGFMILFFFAMISRFTSRYYLTKQYEPKLKLKKGYYFSFFKFLKKARKNNFGKFSIFRALINLAAAIASPFFSVYMLRNLGFSYTTYMTIILSQTVFALLSAKPWGKFADKYGNYEVMKITAILVPLYPILWLISNNPLFIILGPQLIGGIAWSGFNLAAGNFIFDSVTPQKRGLAVSYHNMLNGIGIFIGASIGALLIKTISINFMDKILFIFLISSFARMAVSLIMLSKFKEVREIEPFDSSKALRYITPKGIIHNIQGTTTLIAKRRIFWRKKN